MCKLKNESAVHDAMNFMMISAETFEWMIYLMYDYV